MYAKISAFMNPITSGFTAIVITAGSGSLLVFGKQENEKQTTKTNA